MILILREQRPSLGPVPRTREGDPGVGGVMTERETVPRTRGGDPLRAVSGLYIVFYSPHTRG